MASVAQIDSDCLYCDFVHSVSCALASYTHAYSLFHSNAVVICLKGRCVLTATTFPPFPRHGLAHAGPAIFVMAGSSRQRALQQDGSKLAAASLRHVNAQFYNTMFFKTQFPCTDVQCFSENTDSNWSMSIFDHVEKQLMAWLHGWTCWGNPWHQLTWSLDAFSEFSLQLIRNPVINEM